MRYPAYPAYKDSGVEWLGEVPEHWETKRLKYSATINDEALPETTAPDFEFSYVDIGSVNPVEGITQKEQMIFDTAPSRARRRVKPGDTIVSTVRTYLKAIAPIHETEDTIIVSTGFAVVRPRKVAAEYLSWALRESSFVESIVARSVGVSYPAVNASEIGCIHIPLPPSEEQCIIGNFLDVQVAKIDALLAKKRELIERLKEKRMALISRTVTSGLPPEAARAAGLDPHPPMKNSGVDWLGEVPEHWEVITVRYVAKRIQTGGTPPTAEERYYENGTVPWYGPGSFDDQIVLSRPVKLLNALAVREGAARMFKAGATMVVAIGATLGKVSSIEDPGSCNQQITVIEFDSRHVHHRFGTYQLRRLERYLRAIAPSATLPILDQGEIGDIQIVLPPIDEQRTITSYIDCETARIDKMIAKIDEVIERVYEYRSALITAAVTGKIDVSGGVA